MKKIDKNKPRFLYNQFVEILKREIKQGKYKPSGLVPSERVLVQRYNISRTTVRRAISQLISEGWLYSLPGTGTFVSKTIPPPKKTRSKNIACILKVGHSPFDSPYYSKIFRSMQDESAGSGYQFSFYSFIDESKEDIVSLVKKRNLDGVIFIGNLKKKIYVDVYKSGTPLVIVDNYFNKKDIVTINPDNKDGAYQATKYLIKLGHKKIYFFGGDLNDAVAFERFNGYRKALAQADIFYKKQFYVKSNYRVADGCKSMERVLKLGKLPTAILAINDEAAIGAIKAIRENSQLKIPKDISIIGFDDIDWAYYAHPPLTTVRLQKVKMGSLAVDFLIKQIEKEEKIGIKIILPTELIIRSSCSQPLKNNYPK